MDREKCVVYVWDTPTFQSIGSSDSEYYVCVSLYTPTYTTTKGVYILSNSGAFKTLDKDNNGTIKVNVQEVMSSQLLEILEFRLFNTLFW